MLPIRSGRPEIPVPGARARVASRWGSRARCRYAAVRATGACSTRDTTVDVAHGLNGPGSCRSTRPVPSADGLGRHKGCSLVSATVLRPEWLEPGRGGTPGSRSACASVLPGVIPWAARPPVRRPGTLRPCRRQSLRAYPERQALGRRSVHLSSGGMASHQMLRTPLRASLALGAQPNRFRLNESLLPQHDCVKRYSRNPREVHRTFHFSPFHPQMDPRLVHS